MSRGSDEVVQKDMLMRTWVKKLALIVATVGFVVPAGAQDADQGQDADQAGELDPAAVAAGQAALAERFAEMAHRVLRGERLGEAEFRQAAALLRAAATLSPAEPRFWRLLVEAELQLGNGDGALSALQGYRKIAPNDRVAQIQLIELHESRMESGDKALAYLRAVLAKEAVPAEVRSHVAVLLVRRLLDRGEEGQVSAVLDQALTLNPVNVAALDLKYELVSGRGGPAERAAGLLALLRANPIRPAAMAELARLVADAGLGKESLEWFRRAADLYAVAGAADPFDYHDVVVDYAAQVYLAGQIQAARGMVDQLLKANPEDVDAWLLRLVIERGAGDEAAYAKAREQAAAGLAARWGAVAKAIAAPPAAEGQEGAGAGAGADADAVAPADVPEPSAVAEQVKAAGDEQKQAMFVSAAADFAWFEVYFNDQPGAATKWVDALATVLPEDNVTLARLRGWAQAANKQAAEARQTLAPQRESDPLSALGLVRLDLEDAGGDPAAQKAADDKARELLSGRQSGLVGAILAQGLKDRDLVPGPHPDAAAIRQELQKFPRAWLDIIEAPQRFYSIRVEPLRVAHRYGEPMFARIVVQNLSDFDITIGENGVVRPGLWFDAQAQAMQAHPLHGTAFERLSQSTVLPARQGLAQYMRFDQGGLAEFLGANPSPQFQLTGWCMSNPAPQRDGFGPGPAGFRVPFVKKLTRAGFPIGKPGALEQLARGLEAGVPETKIRDLDLLAAVVPGLRNAKAANGGPPAQGAALAQQLVDQLAETTADPMPAVAQWARFELAGLGEPGQQAEAVEALLADTRWEGRLLGLVASPKLGAGKAEDLAVKVAESEREEPFVKDYAAALVAMLQRPPASTQPAGEGADGAVPPAVQEPAGAAPETDDPSPAPAEAGEPDPESPAGDR
jgi:tetratricopeptide (TPR) repeat protein